MFDCLNVCYLFTAFPGRSGCERETERKCMMLTNVATKSASVHSILRVDHLIKSITLVFARILSTIFIYAENVKQFFEALTAVSCM